MIVVATDDFEVYHDVVAQLRDRGATFTTISPGDPVPEGASALIAATGEDPPTGDADAEVVTARPDEARAAVDAALQATRETDGRLVVGIDPGERPGIAVLAGETVVAAFQVPLSEAPAVVREEIADAADPVVRIGDGARLQGARLIDALSDVRVELVDERGTTPHLGAGATGASDIVAAINIARREGEVVESREVDPTTGELETIKERSRELSPENRAIDERLARRVATGDLTVEEALEIHRRRG